MKRLLFRYSLITISSMIQGYITTKEAAKKLKVSEGRVRQFIANGRLPAVKVGHTNLVKESDLKLVEKRPNGRPKKSDKKD